MVHFVGAGPGAPDLITVRGKTVSGRGRCDHLCRISCKSASFLNIAKDVCTIHNSAKMTLGRSDPCN